MKMELGKQKSQTEILGLRLDLAETIEARGKYEDTYNTHRQRRREDE